MNLIGKFTMTLVGLICVLQCNELSIAQAQTFDEFTDSVDYICILENASTPQIKVLFHPSAVSEKHWPATAEIIESLPDTLGIVASRSSYFSTQLFAILRRGRLTERYGAIERSTVTILISSGERSIVIDGRGAMMSDNAESCRFNSLLPSEIYHELVSHISKYADVMNKRLQ